MFAEVARETGGPARSPRGGGPLLIPRGAPGGMRAEYLRASSFANRVKDLKHIHTWQKRYLAIALAQPGNRQLLNLLAGEVYNTFDPELDKKEKAASGRRVDEVIERALDRQGISDAADRGTAIHSWFDPRNDSPVPDELKPWVDGYRRCLADNGIRILESERFLANDEVMAAGSADMFLHWPARYGDDVVVGDGKTGKLDAGFAVQMAIYANADFYDTDTDQRTWIVDHFEGEYGLGYRRDVGVIFDVKEHATTIHEVDLLAGWDITKAIADINEQLTLDLFEEIPQAAAPDPWETHSTPQWGSDEVLRTTPNPQYTDTTTPAPAAPAPAADDPWGDF